eukprot:CAMPEP_0117035310 /NCGR_PEP_ID=MMETSP0472-20121206/25089_1 /TAXON_ID=693140 ORGANISM="Tiarina fusus, Strain LIS" /NCGR_SAMPLE_ID=MMETSP0472 /ASSEMBLY_ACC=CAM_ASM_000603 /LENGTH=270 /DNA_ID=CAMNT_0004744749 /DNA_START=184 /DNA_END=996 /DNA_ORIENTATION=-
MFQRLFNLSGLSLLLLSPVTAQFGVAGGRKKAASFQELNEQAKQMAGSGAGGGAAVPDMAGLDLGDLSKMFEDMDPAALEEMAKLGPELDEIMKMMAEMSPEQLQKQMEDAMKMMASDEMMENMLSHQDEVLASLEEMGQIDPEELAKFKKDPEYFQQKMKEGMDQMREIFQDPEMLQVAAESMQGLTDLYNNPDQLVKMMEGIFEDFNDDEAIEKARQMLLTNPDLGHPSLGGLFDTDEMKEILADPVKWRENVKEGQGILQGAGVGEL